MIKVAQKKVQDPVQKALRERKSKWNKKVSLFIDNVINFKKMINGSPSKFFMQKSKITEEIPNNPSDLLNNLLQSFNELVNESNAIIASQLAYAKERQKNKPVNLLKPASVNYELTVEASNAITRFISSLKGKRFGNSIDAIKTRARLSLLKMAVDLNKLCSKFQSKITKFDFFSSDLEGLHEANEIILKMENDLLQIMQSFQIAAKKIGTEKDLSKSNNDIEKINIVDNIIKNDWNDFNTYFTDIDISLKKDMDKYIKLYESSDNNELKLQAAEKIIDTYKEVLLKLNALRHSNETSLQKLLKITSSSEEYDLISEADYALSKKYNKTMRSLINRKTNSSRLLSYQSADDMRDGLNKFMDLLESDFNPEELAKILNNNIFTPFAKMKEHYSAIMASMDYDTSGMDEDQKSKLDKLIMNRKNRMMAERLAPKIPNPNKLEEKK